MEQSVSIPDLKEIEHQEEIRFVEGQLVNGFGKVREPVFLSLPQTSSHSSLPLTDTIMGSLSKCMKWAGWGQPGGCGWRRHGSQSLPCLLDSIAGALLPTGFCFVPQMTGWFEMELSNCWAASPSSLKRFSGLPMACPTPSALQTISAC